MSRATIIFLDRRELGTVAAKRLPPRFVAKLRRRRSGEEIEVWGDGKQTRSFLYIDECVEGTVRLLRSNFAGPVNIGSEEMVTINQLVDSWPISRARRSIKNMCPDRRACAAATLITG